MTAPGPPRGVFLGAPPRPGTRARTRYGDTCGAAHPDVWDAKGSFVCRDDRHDDEPADTRDWHYARRGVAFNLAARQAGPATKKGADRMASLECSKHPDLEITMNSEPIYGRPFHVHRVGRGDRRWPNFTCTQPLVPRQTEGQGVSDE